MKLIGFDKNILLQFTGYDLKENGLRSFLQEAYEEGTNMGELSKNMLLLLDWTESELLEEMRKEKNESIIKYYQSPLDDLQFEQLDGSTAIYLTGDNCRQPSEQLVIELAKRCWKNRGKIDDFLNEFSKFAKGASS